MSSDLLSIARSGAKAARIALDVTAQNIANASTEGYVRRTAKMSEVSTTGYLGQTSDVSLSGVRVSQVVRNADAFRQSEVRRTGSDTARADAEVTGLSNVETALEQSNVYDSITSFESTLQKLKEDPTDSSLRASVVESARTMTNTFQIASQQLDAVGNGLHFEANAGVTEVNRLAQELARTNVRLARASDATSDQTSLLDQRDNLLQQMSQYGDIATTFSPDGTVKVQIGGAAGPAIVNGGSTDALTAATAADGTITFSTASGASVALSGGSLAGQNLALGKLSQLHGDLDALAANIVTTVNGVQTGGVDVDGNAGVAMFSGTDAASFSLALTNGSQIATAPAGAAAKSLDTTNLDALRNALGNADPAGKMDSILFDVSSAVSGRTVTRDALKTISDSAKTTLAAQSGVDLDSEAVNLVRYQQAFQASGRVMQVASNIFDTLIGIR